MKEQGIKISEKTLRRYMEYDYQKELREDAENAQLAKAYIKYFLNVDFEEKNIITLQQLLLKVLKQKRRKGRGALATRS